VLAVDPVFNAISPPDSIILAPPPLKVILPEKVAVVPVIDPSNVEF